MRSMSDKYIAGFLDADGSIWVDWKEKKMWLEFIQKTSNNGVLERIRETLGCGALLHKSVTNKNGTISEVSRVAISGQRAVDMVCRLKPHLVAKRERADRFLIELGYPERVGKTSIPNHPSRAWLAGIFDGDGCLYAGFGPSRTRTASVKASIDGCTDETKGLELAQKGFGGVIETRGSGKQIRWTLRLDASKAINFLSYIAPHLLVKREQAYFILGCAKKYGHFRDGEIIVPTLKAMKTHPHRLSDLATEVDISESLSKVRNFKATGPGIRYRHALGQKCANCGRDGVYSRDLCNPCWQKERYYRLKRQSEQHESDAV